MLSAAIHCAAEARRCRCAGLEGIGSAMKATAARGIDCLVPAGLSALPA
jgi:hypothetical protein